MKKYLSLLFLAFFGLSLYSAPICLINQELNKDTASQLSQFRQQTTDTCLACNDDSCKLKSWPAEKRVIKLFVNCYFAPLVTFRNFLKSLTM